MEIMGRTDLMDRFDALLPRVDPADEARQILGVMARICKASSAAVFFERRNSLGWIAGDRLSDEVHTAIKIAWVKEGRRVLTGTAFTELGAPAGEPASAARLMWMRQPEDGGLDAVYFAGPGLRPLETCARRLLRLAALLARLH
jgi:hypothetical protein